MKKLYQLLGTIDDNATKAFIELQKSQLKVRKSVSDWIKLHRLKELPPNIQKEMNIKCANIAKYVQKPLYLFLKLLKKNISFQTTTRTRKITRIFGQIQRTHAKGSTTYTQHGNNIET
jgi:hypothetical protein